MPTSTPILDVRGVAELAVRTRFAAPAVFLAALAILVLRLPEALLRAEFLADDGYLYTQALERGAAVLAETYAGYLIVGQQAVVLLELLVPPTSAPLVGNLVAFASMAAVAAYVAVAPLPWPRGVGLAMAAVVVLAPAAYPLLGTLSHAQWAIALWLAVVPLAVAPATGSARAGPRTRSGTSRTIRHRSQARA